MDYLHYPYPSRRSVTFARKGMVATSQPLAAQAGLDILKAGGNAIDAAIATAACLTVVEPTSNGIGSDAFALVWTEDKLHGLNASGAAPQGISLDALVQSGHKEMPRFGFTPVTVPGAPGAWAELARRFGRLPLTKTLAPAITYARHGYPVSPNLGYFWQRAHAAFKQQLKGQEFAHWFETFAPQERPPAIGEIWRSPDHADSLEKIAATNGDAFYRGELAEQIDSFSRRYGGYIRGEDLAAFTAQWVEPIKVSYRGHEVWEIPPNGQGLVALIALGIIEGFDLPSQPTTDSYHLQMEAIKLAFADGLKHITDQEQMGNTASDFLSASYLRERRQLISANASQPIAGQPPRGGTVYLAAADSEGNMVSYIQSNYMGFGSGLVVPGTGIALQNRGHNFSLDREHPNALAPGKRTFHTIIPGFLSKDNVPLGPFGVMGGFMQPQGHMQVVMNLLDFGHNIQAALDAPRWQWLRDKTVEVEAHFDPETARALSRLGHKIEVNPESGSFGRGQIIFRESGTGVLSGATEPRTDGAIACW